MSNQYNLDSLLDGIEEDGFDCFNEVENKNKRELDDCEIDQLLQASISNMNQRKEALLREKEEKKRQRELYEILQRESELSRREADMFRIEFEHRNRNINNNVVNTIPLNKLIELMKKMENNNDPCPICFTNNEELEITLCGHIFCKKCIKEVKNNKCPMCRS
jgi:hypothetical protein